MRRREPEAMEILYDRLSRQAFALAYRILGDGPAAEDAVQEAFLTVWRQAEKVNLSRGKLSSFVLTVVHHKAIDVLRARKGTIARQVPLDSGVFEKEGEDVMDRVLLTLGRDAVRRALKSLPEEQLQPMQMAYFEGMTHAEIAETLRLPLGTVKSRLRLGLEKLRTALSSESEAES